VAALPLLRSRDVTFHEAQQLRWFHAEAACKIKQCIQRRAFLPAFQLPDVVPMIAGLVSKGVLGAPLLLAEPPKYRAEGSLGAGGSPAPGC
jgi:hypothetical protein